MTRVCACGCGTPLDGLRADARWASRAHAVRWARTHPGKPLTAAGSANRRRTRAGSGRQVSYRKAVDAAAAAIEASRFDQATPPRTLAERFMQQALPANQRKGQPA